jgi:pre-mRNA-processing factor SLU7
MSGTFRGQPKKPDTTALSKERNEYIPSFIATKPFYVPDTGDGEGDSNDYLEHQRLQKQQDDSLAKAQWYDRGKKVGPAATKFRKGACENCGALTHKVKDCLQRKRKNGARWTGRDIAADERVGDVKLGWDAKRDRWNGYDAQEYDKVVEEYNELEALKKKTGDGEEGEDGEGDRYEEETDMGRQQQNSTRQLRLREDTAKYLLNLDLDSAKYDPKTRSMVDMGQISDAASALVAEEGFIKKSGDADEFERAQKYAWESQEKGGAGKVHLQANPTEGAFLRKKELEDAKAKKEAKAKMLLDKYGVQPDTAPLKDLAIEESEKFVEYDERGRVKGLPKVKRKSKYPEDVLLNNHTSVWGSWWSDFRWGYACCHSLLKNSYCTGEQGKQAFEETERLKSGADLLDEDTIEVPKQIAWQDEEILKEHVPNEVGDDRKAKDDERRRKRTIHEMRDGTTEEEMEEYRRKKLASHDPMAKMEMMET